MMLQESLKRLRAELGYSQTELARALQVSFTTINRWENGKVVPNEHVAKSVVQLVERMDVTPSYMEYIKKAFFPEGDREVEKVRRLDMNMAGQLVDESTMLKEKSGYMVNVDTESREDGLLFYYIGNVTRNALQEYKWCHLRIPYAEKCNTLDELVGLGAKFIRNVSDMPYYHDIHNRENLAEGYKRGIKKREYETQLRIPNGKVIWVRAVLRLFEEPQTGDLILHEYVYNIDTEKVVEQLLTTVLCDDYTAVGSLNICDEQYTILEFDEKTGKPKTKQVAYEEMAEKYANCYVCPEDRDYYLRNCAIENVLDGAINHRSFTVRIQKDGNMRYMLHRAYMIDQKRNICLLTRKDVTEQVLEEFEEREKLQEALDKSERAGRIKSSFLARMGHDLQTSMNTILELIALTKEETADESAAAKNLDRMKTESDYMLGLIRDILDHSMIENGSFVLKKEPYSYVKFLSGLKNYFEPLCIEKGIQFKFEEVTESTVVETDPERLNQIFFAILSNAVEYTEPGGIISYYTENLKVESGKISCDYCIQDTGVGMSENFQKHMFESFSQQDNAIAAEYKGAGLGLGNAKRLTEAMGGTLQVKSKKGIGTTVIIHLSFRTMNEQIEHEDKQ